MGMNIQLYPCDRRVPEGVFRSEVCFELSSWCSEVLGQITPHAIPITIPVEIPWVVGAIEKRWPPSSGDDESAGDEFDPGCTWMVPASVLKPLTFAQPDWHPDRVAYHRAIEAFIWELPDDWPFIVYYV